MLYSRTSLFIHSIYNSLHLLTPNSHSIPPPPPWDQSWVFGVCGEGKDWTEGNLIGWGQGYKGKKIVFCSAWGLFLIFVFAPGIQATQKPASCSIPPSDPVPCFPLHFFISLHLSFFSFFSQLKQTVGKKRPVVSGSEWEVVGGDKDGVG